MNDKCEWVFDEDYNYFETSCKTSFALCEGSLKDNDYNYCPYCGLEIKEC